jgi:vacuolar-type H+-ATPase subunit D/Vma8
VATTNQSGRWKPGQSGNPHGRRPGTSQTQKLRQAIEAHIPSIVARLVEKAKEGDVSAARLLLERTVPSLRPVEAPQPIEVPDGAPAEQARAIVALAAAGEVSVEQGSRLISSLGSLCRLIELEEIERRINSLEQTIAPR